MSPATPKLALAHGPELSFPAGFPRTLPEALRRSARVAPSSGVLHVDDLGERSLQTYPELLREARCVLGGLRTHGARPGDPVVLQVEGSRAFLAVFWGAILGGLLPVPLALPSGAKETGARAKLRNVCRLLDAPFVVTDQPASALDDVACRGVLDAARLLDAPEDEIEHSSVPGDVAYLQFSSGSTAAPKGVTLTHANLAANLLSMVALEYGRDAIARCFAAPEEVVASAAGPDRAGGEPSVARQDGLESRPMCSWLPYTHDMGLIGYHLAPLVLGELQVKLPTTSFVRNPARYLHLLHELRVAYTPAPNFAVLWLVGRTTGEELRGLDLSGLRTIHNGAEPISAAAIRLFVERFAAHGLDPGAMCPVYGLAEAGLLVSRPPLGEGPRFHALDRESLATRREARPAGSSAAIELADEGHPAPGVSIRIVDDRDRVLAESSEGHVQICGPNVTRGYFGDAHATRAAFCGRWLRTGDLGFLRDGRLVVTGRHKDVLFVNGRNQYAHDLEAEIQQLPVVGFRNLAVVGSRAPTGERDLCVLFVKRRGETSEDLEELLRRVNAELPARVGVALDAVCAVAEIPRTTSGKVQRFLLRERFLRDGLPDPGAAPAGMITAVTRAAREDARTRAAGPSVAGGARRTLADLWRGLLGVDAVRDDDGFFELGGDSLLLTALHAELEQRLERRIDRSDLFACACFADQLALLEGGPARAVTACAGGLAPSDPPTRAGEATSSVVAAQAGAALAPAHPRADGDGGAGVAIVGMACRFAGAETVEELWQQLLAGRCAVRTFPAQRRADLDALARGGAGGSIGHACERSPEVARGAFLERIDLFDARAFRVSPREAERMDPQQRIVLETVLHALADAGYGDDALAGTRTGVFVGASAGDFAALLGAADAMSLRGNLPAMLAGRISATFDLRGPSTVIDTACSSSLAALHLACQSLRSGESETALVAGVSVSIEPLVERLGGVPGLSSADGLCRSFDGGAAGIGWGEGAGALLLKPLAAALRDGDHVYAVLRSGAVGHAGRAASPMAPMVEAQRDVLLRAWEAGAIDPETIAYVEAHGAGTALGDHVELTALARAFAARTARRQFCAVGSIKGNVGDTGAACGVAAVIKATLALERERIPATLHFSRPPAGFDFAASALFVGDAAERWPRGDVPRRAGVTATGLAGTTVHVVLEEAPVPGPTRDAAVAALAGRRRHWPEGLGAAADRGLCSPVAS